MIVRTWTGRVPVANAEDFHAHLLATGVADYRKNSGCCDVRLWRRDDADVAVFSLVSLWIDMDAIRAYAGEALEIAVLYPEDEAFELDPDRTVQHHQLLLADPMVNV
jgi:quinol monooxygenase YgiN